jgi:quercetin dioxygenase-like cupin family protein
MSNSSIEYPPVPPDDLDRPLTFSNPDADAALPHIGLAGNTYTITVSGKDTNGRFCVVDMHVPPGGGPAPHRHDCEETFIVLEGQVEATFRGKKYIVRAGETINIPASAPHRFQNNSDATVRMLCICSPAGQEELFRELGAPVATRTTVPPKLDGARQREFIEKAKSLAPKYRTEILETA